MPIPIPPFLIQLAKMAATTFASAAASSAASRFAEGFTKADTEPSNEEIQDQEYWQQFFDGLQGEFEKTKKQLEETKKQLEETKKQLKKERQKHERQIVVAGVLCLILGSLVSSVTWYALQPGQPSEQIISLEELEKYEKARDAGLQALEDYVIQNPNSPYISQAKALILIYKGKE